MHTNNTKISVTMSITALLVLLVGLASSSDRDELKKRDGPNPWTDAAGRRLIKNRAAGELYNPFTQRCCSGVAFRMHNSFTDCCGNTTYDYTEQICCGGQVKPRKHGTRTACCGEEVYDLKAAICCLRSVSILPQGTPPTDLQHFECCNGAAHDTRNGTCKDDDYLSRQSLNVFNLTAASASPLGCQNVNPKIHLCCEGEIKDTRGPNTLCCGKRSYDYTNEACCFDGKNFTLTPKPRPNGLFYDCCGGRIHESEKGLCCNHRLLEPPNGEKWNEYSCCGDNLIDDRMHFCCEGQTIHEKMAGTQKCCGNSSYDVVTQDCCRGGLLHATVIHKRTQVCCSNELLSGNKVTLGHVVNKTSDSSQCCGNVSFDYAEGICCGGKVHLFPNKTDDVSCCGNSTYHKQNAFCCEGKLTEITNRDKSYCCPSDDPLRCCGNVTFDEHEEFCCGTKLYPVHNKTDNLSCCGDNPYDDMKQSCCDNTLVDITDPKKTRCCSVDQEESEFSCKAPFGPLNGKSSRQLSSNMITE